MSRTVIRTPLVSLIWFLRSCAGRSARPDPIAPLSSSCEPAPGIGRRRLPSIPADLLNVVVAICLITLCIGIALVILRSERRPRYAQVAFLVIAAFCITNKVYSPQYVLWLIPLAAMARPRWRDFLIWQITQVIYFASIWYFLQQYGNDNKGLPEGWYVAAILVLILGTCWFAGMVIRDIVRPQHDPIRTDGYDEHRDDPGGGVLDFAEDVVTLRR